RLRARDGSARRVGHELGAFGGSACAHGLPRARPRAHRRRRHLTMTMWQPEPESPDRPPLGRLSPERNGATPGRVRARPPRARRLPGVRAEDISRVEDWHKLPFLTKEELRDAYPYGLACARASGYRRIQMSSGTTGNPILNPYTAADVAQWGEVMARCYAAAG